ncbi:SDR family oxidoreductase [Agrobacterium sp. SOY23]|uniref:SDR family NAD(P)-dependent oxidoreductase n=1 Tax=Agrobacterium sp. SOY23 TaxID=3014555 RepID=UPI0022B03E13|nr:SDR family NAD(P)-dependent oxidoreductase [Agrobacterium sp. SOY23]MCZ4433035.1 SDR family oxidoreductase [Agrobacterium sp. SOY23]
MEFADKVVVVTGAGSGMGRAMVSEFIARGARVAALGRTLEKVEESVRLAGDPEKGKAFSVNVATESDVVRVIDEIIALWGRVDVLVNNAGVLDSYEPAHTVSLDAWQEVIAINLTGPFLMSKYVIPQMLEQGKGTIINIASLSSFSAAGGGSAYTASKHGVLGLTRQLCFEYGAKGIRVNAICPGATATPMALHGGTTEALPDMASGVMKTPAQRWCKPEEVARLTAFLAGGDADFVHGSAFVIDGGWLTAAREAF